MKNTPLIPSGPHKSPKKNSLVPKKHDSGPNNPETQPQVSWEGSQQSMPSTFNTSRGELAMPVAELKDSKTKKSLKNYAKKEARAAERANKAQARSAFFEELGHDMADELVKESTLQEGSLNLVDRLKFTKTTSTTLNTAFTCHQSSSTESLSSEDAQKATAKSSRKTQKTFNLNDFAALAAIEELISLHGKVSHMGILDKSYTFFITENRKAALYYKVKDKIAVVGGDPLCPPALFSRVLSEFEKFRRQSNWGIAFLGASGDFLDYVRQHNWVTMCFGIERVLNPLTNPVLLGTAGKSVTVRNKQLLNPRKGGLTVEVYSPCKGKKLRLQQQLVNVYDAWREHRNASGVPQAFITVYDPFAMLELMTYVYTKGHDGIPNGFAALRILGANHGYHLDPCVAAPGAPKGITDLLTFASMALLNRAKISYLSLGYEPLQTLGEVTGTPKVLAKVSKKMHGQVFQGLHVAGKKDYHDKFHPDKNLESDLYIVFPPGIPSGRHITAIMHVANISLRQVFFKKLAAKSETWIKVRREEGEKNGNLSQSSSSSTLSRDERKDSSQI